jgi:hypothetical protein
MAATVAAANTIMADQNANRIYASTINTTTGGGFFFVSEDRAEMASGDAEHALS